jgi:predicted nucleic acid-binding protein
LSVNFLVDTSVLVYAIQDAHELSPRAAEVVRYLGEASRAWTTPQVVAEFFVSSTRSKPAGPGVSPLVAVRFVQAWMDNARFVELTRAVSQEALRGAIAYQMRLYDAQMWAVARLNGLSVLSQDAQSRRIIEGVRYVNPFAPGFQFADLDA